MSIRKKHGKRYMSIERYLDTSFLSLLVRRGCCSLPSPSLFVSLRELIIVRHAVASQVGPFPFHLNPSLHFFPSPLAFRLAHSLLLSPSVLQRKSMHTCCYSGPHEPLTSTTLSSSFTGNVGCALFQFCTSTVWAPFARTYATVETSSRMPKDSVVAHVLMATVN